MTLLASRGRVGLAAVAVTISALLTAPAGAHAAQSDEQALAEKYAPVVSLVDQKVDCGPGEPFEPSDVDAVLGNRSVALKGPWDQGRLVEIAPTGHDLGAGLFGYYLDFPGDPLNPGCGYEQWARAATEGTTATTYAHVATEPGRADRLALQYWFFYPFNDYNNKHEGDWEMIQLIFKAGNAADALDQEPIEAGYSQHEGLEVARWGDPKLELVDGTHPVVHVAAGSHANYFDSALYLGRSAAQGFGCDDTRTPAHDVRPAVQAIPNDTAAARAAFPWIAYEGRWGQHEQAFYDGPTGPNTKAQWDAPITFEEQEGRDRSYAVPAGGLFGTTATDFFCGAVAGGSNLLRGLTSNPLPLLITLGLVVLLAVYLIRRTSWRPTAPLRAARRRAGGQILAAAARMYTGRWLLFVGIGLLTIPAFLLVAGLQSVLVAGPTVAGVQTSGEAGGLRVFLAALVSYLLIGLTIVFVLAATTRALAELDEGREVRVRRAYTLALQHWRGVTGAFLTSSIIVGLFGVTVVLVPIAVVLSVAFALYVPVLELEGASALASLRRSAALVRHRVLKVAVLLAISILLASLLGPLLGTLLILITNAPFPLVNVVAGLTFAFLMPYVGLTMAYVYYDTLVRTNLPNAEPTAPRILPAELTPAGPADGD